MSEKRFTLRTNSVSTNYPSGRIFDNKKQHSLYLDEVVFVLNEQQSTITKLKELNGDKGKRIISLIRTNKTLKEENEQLREINKELGDDLYNCRLNKNIIREKLKLWQDVHKEYGIYSIKDFEESFELDAKINKEKGI